MTSLFKKNKLEFSQQVSFGFTLAEVMVTAAIFSVISAVVLISYAKFGGDVVITDLANDVALSIRQAQTYGVSVRGSGSNFNSSYGVHFNLNETSGDKNYVLFIDNVSGDQKYSGSHNYGAGGCTSGTECLSVYTLTQGNRIQEMCYLDGSNVQHCSASGGSDPYWVDIVFTRPNPDAIIKVGTGSGGSIVTSVSAACVHLVSVQGVHRYVQASITGQISVQNSQCF